MLSIKVWYVLLFFVLLSGTTVGQLTADFSANTTDGCAPLVVTFNDLSTPASSITSRTWELDFNGITVSGNPNPVFAYTVPGVYTIKLTVSDGSSTASVTKTGYITVYSNPIPDFSISPPAGCAPLTVNFQSTSQQGPAPSGAISTYSWNFPGGGPNTSSQANPTVTYNVPGNYTPALTVVDANGCSATKDSINSVIVSSGPTVAMTTNSPKGACSPPYTVAFINNSSGLAPLTYSWDFGDGGTSTQANPSYTYTSTGVFTVTLTAIDQAGCSTTVAFPNYITIQQVNAAFTPSSNPACVDNFVSFFNSSTFATNYQWTFGNGFSSGGFIPSAIYNSPGTYPVKLVASGVGCQDSVTKQITIEQVTAAFASSPNYGCQAPHIVTFTDQSQSTGTPVNNWTWVFGPADTSILQNNTNIYTPGSYTTFLAVSNATGCVDTIIDSNHINVVVNRADFNMDPPEGCVPLTVQFTDSSSNQDSIIAWHWDFGTGDTSILQSPTYTFTDTGRFGVTLTITHPVTGCEQTFTDTVLVGAQFTPAYTVMEDTVCAFDGAQFMDATVDSSGYVNEWEWTFSDGSGLVDQQNPLHIFIDTGWIDLSYVVKQNGCPDTLIATDVIYVLGPIVSGSFSFSCSDPYVYQFTGNIKDATDFYWNFGDSTGLDSINLSPVHTYAQSGNYGVSILAKNSDYGCIYQDSLNVYPRNAQAVITASNIQLCAPDFINLTSNSSIGALSDTGEFSNNYLWNLGNGFNLKNADTIDSIWINTGGVFPIQLIAVDTNLCEDTATLNILASEITADFSWNFSGICDPATITFTDNSISDTNVVGWSWTFGDGVGTSTLQNPAHTYQGEGSFSVRLVVTDLYGCKDSIVKSILIPKPTVDFVINKVELCTSDPAIFTNQSAGISLTYVWDFGDGSQTSTAVNPTHLYVLPGSYTVTLSGTNSFGCTRSKSIDIEVQGPPGNDFEVSLLDTTCYPADITFTYTSDSTGLDTWTWDFDDGSDPVNVSNTSLIKRFTRPGTYDIFLTATSSFGCINTSFNPGMITIGGPFATFSVDPDSVCPLEPVTFTLDSTVNLFEFVMVYQDGDADSLTPPLLQSTHSYRITGTQFPVAVLADSLGVCRISLFEQIYIDEVEAAFSVLPDTVGCDPFPTQMDDQSFRADTYSWNFGDGGSSTAQEPAHVFSPPGTYNIHLIVTNDSTGCSNEAFRDVVVNPNPTVLAEGDTLICREDTTNLLATASVPASYLWNPVAGLNDASIPNPIASPDSNTVYTIVVTDSNGCIASDSVLVDVQQVPTLLSSLDTSIIIGEVIDGVPIVGWENYIYVWSPPTALSCTNCQSPVADPLVSTEYTLLVKDLNGCFEVEFKYFIEVLEQYSVDVPTAFSPNGDGINDQIFVGGWGIETLLEFKIFNRWGQLIFDSSDINYGWDGTFRGKPQPTETYTYLVKAIGYDGQELNRSGLITLMR